MSRRRTPPTANRKIEDQSSSAVPDVRVRERFGVSAATGGLAPMEALRSAHATRNGPRRQSAIPRDVTRRLLVSVLVLVLTSLGPALTSCGGQANGGPSSDHHAPISDRALAVIAAEHLGKPSRAQVEEDPYWLEHPIAAAAVRYPVPSEDGDLVTVQVGIGLNPRMDTSCKPVRPRGGCFTVGGAQVTWWTTPPRRTRAASASSLPARAACTCSSPTPAPRSPGTRGTSTSRSPWTA